jgi:cellulose biosynthesis protein BcsQ
MICTFYSYKGGVGRSMALAHVADSFARKGLRVLMIDFDLEAPGLEDYFSVDQESVRANAGLFDLILHYKAEMSSDVPIVPEDQKFRRLNELFIVPIYPGLPSGGQLDLMPAGRRGSDEQLSEYALGLRQFDWQDFYFNFGGELFFEWLRRTLDGQLYDLVLVDSRTGVTEMGGICAYQLADTIVVLCASNKQNLKGTHDVVRNFFSPRVTMLRAGRSLQLLVVPSRMEMRNDALLKDFRDRFENLFASLAPKELADAGLTYWDLMIPYDPGSAFQERVGAHGSRASGRSAIDPAIQKLVHAIGLLAESGGSIQRLNASSCAGAQEVAEPQYEITSRAAGFDVFLAYSRPDIEAVDAIARHLAKKGLRAFVDRRQLDVGEEFLEIIRKALLESGACAILVGPSSTYPWRSELLRMLLEAKDRATGLSYLPVLLPGASLPPSDVTPPFLAGRHWLRLEQLDNEVELDKLVEALTYNDQTRAKTQGVYVNPYKGLAPFDEADARNFFGREELVGRMVRNLEDTGFLVVVGASGVGKSSVVRAGVIPALRRGAIPGSERWHCSMMTPVSQPVRKLFESLAAVTSGSPRVLRELIIDHAVGGHHQDLESQFILVIDQFEELFTRCERSEQGQFIQLLIDIITNWKGQISVVAVVRSDFLSRLIEFSSAWANLVETNIALVGPMSRTDMRRAIEAPAQASGLAIEPGLTDLILNDTAGAAGALPLLQYLLWALWERSRQGYLTVEAYNAIGGVAGSLARDAEAFFHQLVAEEKRNAMTVLLRLIGVNPDGIFTRRRATLDELMVGASPDKICRIVDGLVSTRLVVVSSDSANQPTFELAHDSIVVGWPRFRRHIEEESQWLSLRARLTDSAARWQQSSRDSDFLYTEGEMGLLKARGALDRHRDLLSPIEIAFITASERAFSLRDRKRRLIQTVTLLLLVLMTSLAVFALQQQHEAERAQVVALEETQRATLANLSAASAISPDGTRMLQIDPDGALRIIDLATGLPIRATRPAVDKISAAIFGADGWLLATGTLGGVVSIDDILLRPVTTIRGHEAAVTRLAFSPDGNNIASGSDDSTAKIWSVAKGALLLVIKADSPVVGVAFSPDGLRVIVSSQNGKILIADSRTGQIIR